MVSNRNNSIGAARKLLRQYRTLSMRDKVNILKLAYGEGGHELATKQSEIARVLSLQRHQVYNVLKKHRSHDYKTGMTLADLRGKKPGRKLIYDAEYEKYLISIPTLRKWAHLTLR